MPVLYDLYLDGLLAERSDIVDYARTPYSDDEFRESAYDSVKRHRAHPPEGGAWRDFVKHRHYVTGEFAVPGDMNLHLARDLLSPGRLPSGTASPGDRGAVQQWCRRG